MRTMRGCEWVGDVGQTRRRPKNCGRFGEIYRYQWGPWECAAGCRCSKRSVWMLISTLHWELQLAIAPPSCRSRTLEETHCFWPPRGGFVHHVCSCPTAATQILTLLAGAFNENAYTRSVRYHGFEHLTLIYMISTGATSGRMRRTHRCSYSE